MLRALCLGTQRAAAQQLAQGVACCMASGALPLTPGKRVQGPAGLDSAPSAQRAVLAATR